MATVAAITMLAGTGLSMAAMPTRAATTRADTPAAPAAPGALAAQTPPSAPGGSGFENFIDNTMGPAGIGRQILTGDFNGDGHTDVAAVGGTSYAGIWVALTNGSVVNAPSPDFAGWASTAGVRAAPVTSTGTARPTSHPGSDVTRGRDVHGDQQKIRDYAYPLSPHELQPGSVDSPVFTGDFNGDGHTDILSWGWDFQYGPFAFGVFPGTGASYTAVAFVESTG